VSEGDGSKWTVVRPSRRPYRGDGESIYDEEMDRLYHLAQVNVALLREPLDSELLGDFVAALDPVNAQADAATGFVWRLQTDDGDATAVRVFDDDRLIVNMSVWESVEALADYVYGNPEHRAVLKKRTKWFEKIAENHLVLWWIPAGHLPSVEEPQERLMFLRTHGPTPIAFTIKQQFSAPTSESVSADRDDWLCPT